MGSICPDCYYDKYKKLYTLCPDESPVTCEKHKVSRYVTATEVLHRRFKDSPKEYVLEHLKDYPNYPEEFHAELLKRLGF